MLSNWLGEHGELSHQYYSDTDSSRIYLLIWFSYLKEALEARRQFAYKRLEEEEEEKKKEDEKKEEERKEEEKKKEGYAEVYAKK